MSLVAVAPTKFSAGVDLPAALHKGKPASYDWREPPGSFANSRPVTADFAVTELRNALTAAYSTDAHLVSYVVREHGAPLVRQPRIRKDGLPWMLAQGYRVTVDVLVADCDNPGHASWASPEVACSEAARVAELLGTAGVYVTAHGLRLVQPLDVALPVELTEPTMRGWLHELEGQALAPDWACVDWTRHMRLPHVRRDGRPYRPPAVLLEQMRPISPPAPIGLPEKAPRPKKARGVPVSTFTDRAPVAYDELVATLVPAVRAVEAEWHTLFLSLAGALCARRIPPEHVPALCAEISRNAGDTRTDDRATAARTTVERWLAGQTVAGYRALPPVVAQALDAATDAATIRARAQQVEAAPVRPVAEVTAELVDAIRRAPDGLTVIEAQCGLGKTTAARAVAIERAAKLHSTPGEHVQAPHGSKTALSVPTTALALQEVSKLRAEGASVRRLFGPLSVLGEDGKPVCRFADSARALANGGQSIPFEFCEGRNKTPCEHRETCPAYGGEEGPHDARITVGPHGLLDALNGWAGATGLFIIDEPPPALETVVLTVAELEETTASLRYFKNHYASAMAGALLAVTHWTRLFAPLDEAGPLALAFEVGIAPDLEQRAYDATGATKAVDAVRAAFPPEHTGTTAPPIEAHVVEMTRRWPGLARQVGTASKVLRAIWRAVCADTGQVIARVEEREGKGRVLVITWSHEPLKRAFTREGSCVVTDASASVHLPVYASMVGYEPPTHRFAAADGAPIQRTFLHTKGATRSSWLDHGRLVVGAGLVRAVRTAVDWVLEEPETRQVGIVAWKVLELALRAALGDDVGDAWLASGQRPEVLGEVRASLGPMLARLPGRPKLGHYGALRGLDDWRDLDAVITLGDPWPNIGDVQHEVDFLGLGDWEARAEALCRADLEQALGRLRTVHRARPGRLLAVGAMLPGGWGPSTELRRAPEGRPRTEPTMPPEELRTRVEALGGRRVVAALLGIDESTVGRYLSGAQHPSPTSVAQLRGIVCDPVVQKALSKNPLDRGSCTTPHELRQAGLVGVPALLLQAPTRAHVSRRAALDDFAGLLDDDAHAPTSAPRLSVFDLTAIGSLPGVNDAA